MNNDKKQENPTSLISMEMMKNEPKQMTKLLEIYLKEFCKVVGITEKELSTQVIVYSNPQEKFMAVLAVENRGIVKIGVRMTEDTYKISGEYLTQIGKFPKTTKYITSLNG